MNISIPGVLVINGRQGQGKSHVIRFLMGEHRKRFDFGLVFTQTKFGKGNYDYIDPDFVHPEYNPKALLELKRLHARLIKQGKKPCSFVIFDDCITGKQWQCPEMQSAVTQVRHYNFLIIISTQSPVKVANFFRTNVFQTIIFKMQGKLVIQALYEAYGQAFDSLLEFKRYLFDNTGHYSFIYFDSQCLSENRDDQYKIMKCPEVIPPFKIRFKTNTDKIAGTTTD